MNKGEKGFDSKQLVFKNAAKLQKEILLMCNDIVSGNGDEKKIRDMVGEVNQINSLSTSGTFLLELNDSMINYISKNNTDKEKVDSYRSIVNDNLDKMYNDLYTQLESSSVFSVFARSFKDYDPACFAIAHQLIAVGKLNDRRIDYLVGKMSRCDARRKLMKEHYSVLKEAGKDNQFYENKAKEVENIYSEMSQSFAKYVKS